MEDDTTTNYCSNCKRDIPSTNFVMHVNHCQRNITLCKQCQEPVPTSQMEEHFEECHVQVRCECGESIEKMDLEDHKEKSCTSRSVSCEYCELSLPFSEMEAHKEYCGSRTELCEKCKKYIKFRDLEEHSNIKCDLIKPKAPKNNAKNNTPSVPLSAFEAVRSSDQQDEEFQTGFPMSQELMKIFHRGYGTPPIPLPFGQEEPFLSGVNNLIPRGGSPSRSDRSERRRRFKPNNRGPLEHDGDSPFTAAKPLQNNGKAASIKSRAPGPRENDYKPNAHEYFRSREDYDVMASYLQDQEDTMWRSPFTGQFPQAMQSELEEAIADSLDETNLPCEFCGRMFPASELILHQSGCQLSQLNRSSSGPLNNLPRHVEQRAPARPSVDTDEENENYYIEEEDDDVDVKNDSDEEPFLPCEFCEVQLPVHALFHHQATCDVRPPSAVPNSNARNYDNFQRSAQPRTKQSRPARPVHARVLDPNSSDDDDDDDKNVEGMLKFAGSRDGRSQGYRESYSRNGADYTETRVGISDIGRATGETARKSLQQNSSHSSSRVNRSKKNDLSGQAYHVRAVQSLPPLSHTKPFQRTASNELFSAASNGVYRESKKRNDSTYRQGSRGRPGDEREFAPPREPNTTSTATGQRPLGAQKSREHKDTFLQPSHSRTTLGSESEVPGAATTSQESKFPAKKKSTDDLAQARAVGEKSRPPARKKSTDDWTQGKAPSKNPSGVAAPNGGRSNAESRNPRRSGVKTFDLDELSARPARGMRTSDTTGSRRGKQSTQKGSQRKKIA